MKRLVWLSVATLVMVVGADEVYAQCTLPFTLTNGQPPDATKVMANFNALVSCATVGGAPNAIQYNAGSGTLGGAGPLTNGQTLVGSTGNPPQAASLTAGSGVTITNTPGSITIAATAGLPTSGLYRQAMSALPTAANTGLPGWVNQGSATFAESAAGVSIAAPLGPDALILRYGMAPNPPYTLTALIAATRTGLNQESGIGWYDGSSKIHTLSYALATAGGGGVPFIEVVKWSAYNARVGNDAATSPAVFSQPIWLQLKDDGTNVSFAFSHDGANFLTVYTAPKTSAYLGPSGYSFFVLFLNPRAGQSTTTAMSWAIN